MSATNNPTTQEASGDPQVRWPKPPMPQIITASLAVIAFTSILIAIALFGIRKELTIMNSGKAANGSLAPISTPSTRNANQ